MKKSSFKVFFPFSIFFYFFRCWQFSNYFQFVATVPCIFRINGGYLMLPSFLSSCLGAWALCSRGTKKTSYLMRFYAGQG